jgi:RNA polymerase sigma factor (sigma-70 family)
LHEGFTSRLRALGEDSELQSIEDFDPTDEVAVDAVARALLARFRSDDDVAAFTLLFELTHERLVETAGQITRRLAPSIEPEDLASGFMARMFTDVRRRPSQPVRNFLALAYTSMRNDVLDQLRRRKRAQANVQRYQDTLVPPSDPALLAQHAEQDQIFNRFGLAVLRLTGECFHELDPRDQQVLLAREIVRLPYERVAGMLNLAEAQVGMIIRRARVRLVNRITDRLPEVSAEGEEPVREEDISILRDAVLNCLEGRVGTKNVQGLMGRMLEASLEAGRARLADLLYEMAKACLVEAPGFSSHTLIRSHPRRTDVVADDVRQLATRMESVGPTVDVRKLKGTPPAPATALDDAAACLAQLAALEGESGRQQVALALTHIHRGEPGEAEAVLRPLLERELQPSTRQNASRNLALALLRQQRFADALELSEAAADEWPDDPVRVMNLCFAAARLQDADRFEQNARLLLSIQRQSPSMRVQAWIDDMLGPLAAAAGLSEAGWKRLASEVGAPAAPGAGPEGNGEDVAKKGGP